MADAKRTIEIVYNGVDKTALATQSAIRNTSSLASGIQTATQPLSNLAVGALKVEAGLLAVGAAATAASIVVASDFQGAALDLQKVLSDTDSLDKYKDLAIEISNNYGVAATEVLRSMANFKQAGFVAEDAVNLTTNALDLLIAGDVSASAASDLLVASLKGFALEAQSAGTIVDLLNAVSDKYATNLNELLIGFSQLSPVAKQAGLSLEETAGILTPGIEVFRKGSDVATALKTSLINLVSSTAPVEKAFKLLGVSQTDSNNQLRSARDIYFDVAGALQGVDDNQKLYIASLIAGKDQAGRFLAVTEGLNKTLRISGDNFDYAGSAAKEVAIRLGSAEVAADRTKNALVNMLIAIGSPFLDEFTGVANAISNIFKAVGQQATSGQLKDFVTFVEGQMKGLQKTLEDVAKNLPAAFNTADLSGFTKGLTAITGGLSDLFKEIDLTTVDGLAKAITLAGKAFEGLSLFTAGVIQSFGPLFDYFVKLATNLDITNPSLFTAAGNMAGLATQMNLLATNVNALIPALEALLGIFILRQGVGLVGGVKSLSGVLGGSAGLIKQLGPAGLVAAAGTAGFAVGTSLSDAVGFLRDKFTDSRIPLDQFIEKIIRLGDESDLMKSIANDTAGGIKGITIAAKDTDGIETLAEKTKELSVSSLDVSLILLNLKTNVVDAGISFKDFAASNHSLIAAQNGLRPILSDTHDTIIGFEQGLMGAADEADTLSQALIGAVPIYDDLTGKIIGYEQGLIDSGNASDALIIKSANASGAISDVVGETKKATAAQERWNEVMLKAKVDLQIATIRSETAIAVAEIEAGAVRIQAAYDSVNTTITNTGSVITDLFGLMAANNLSLRQQFDVQRQVDIENDRRQVALDLQKKLTEAQIKEMNARANALARGDGLITIQGDGLQPHLEAFMWEILRTIQVRVNADGLDMLLGA